MQLIYECRIQHPGAHQIKMHRVPHDSADQLRRFSQTHKAVRIPNTATTAIRPGATPLPPAATFMIALPTGKVPTPCSVQFVSGFASPLGGPCFQIVRQTAMRPQL